MFDRYRLSILISKIEQGKFKGIMENLSFRRFSSLNLKLSLTSRKLRFFIRVPT